MVHITSLTAVIFVAVDSQLLQPLIGNRLTREFQNPKIANNIEANTLTRTHSPVETL